MVVKCVATSAELINAYQTNKEITGGSILSAIYKIIRLNKILLQTAAKNRYLYLKH